MPGRPSLACLLLLAAAAVCRCGTQPAAEPDLQQARDATVTILLAGADAEGGWVSHGTGTLLHEAGFVLTCEHLSAEGRSQHVMLADGRRYPYRVLARAGGSFDTALLAFEAPPGLHAIALASTPALARGDPVWLLGNAAGAGIRPLRGVLDKPRCGGGTQLQVRGADVRPGDSGGPVLDVHGRQVAHIHVAFPGAPGISRHITSDHVRRAFATVLQAPDSAGGRHGLVVDCTGGPARIVRVLAGRAAAAAGLRVDDVIVAAGRLEVREGLHWVLAALDHPVDEALSVRVRRGEAAHTLILAP